MSSKYGMKKYIKYDKRCFIISSINTIKTKFYLQEHDLRLAWYIVYRLLSYKREVWIKSRSVSVAYCKIRRFKISNYSGILQYIKTVYFNICYSDSSPGNVSPLLWNFYL